MRELGGIADSENDIGLSGQAVPLAAIIWKFIRNIDKTERLEGLKAWAKWSEGKAYSQGQLDKLRDAVEEQCKRVPDGDDVDDCFIYDG